MTFMTLYAAPYCATCYASEFLGHPCQRPIVSMSLNSHLSSGSRMQRQAAKLFVAEPSIDVKHSDSVPALRLVLHKLCVTVSGPRF